MNLNEILMIQSICFLSILLFALLLLSINHFFLHKDGWISLPTQIPDEDFAFVTFSAPICLHKGQMQCRVWWVLETIIRNYIINYSL